MAEADLDAVIRQLAKQQNKSLMGAAKKRSAQYMAKAAKAKDKDAKAQLKLMAKSTLEHGLAAAKRLDKFGRQYRRQLRAGHQIRGGRNRGDEAGQEG